MSREEQAAEKERRENVCAAIACSVLGGGAVGDVGTFGAARRGDTTSVSDSSETDDVVWNEFQPARDDGSGVTDDA